MATLDGEFGNGIEFHCLICHGLIRALDDVQDKLLHPTLDVSCKQHPSQGRPVCVCGACSWNEIGRLRPEPLDLNVYKAIIGAVESGEAFAEAQGKIEEDQRRAMDDFYGGAWG